MPRLKRYTDIPYVLQMLYSKQITLLNANSWDDKNDSHYVQSFCDQKKYGSVLALCMTQAQQTYHHWRIFTNGSSGACVYFDNKKFYKWIAETEGLEGKAVKYCTLTEMQKSPPAVEDLPFLKRRAYEHESEFRLLHCTKNKLLPLQNFSMPISVIDHIRLNPWMPSSTAKVMEDVIHSIDGCEALEIRQASIIRNDEWQQYAVGKMTKSLADGGL